jgi:hypothetical protein
MIASLRLASALGWCLFCLFCRTATAKPPRPSSDVCLESCQSALGSVVFQDVDYSATKAVKQICRSRNAVTSLYLCLDMYCEREARSSELAALNQTCVLLGANPVPPFSIIANYTAGDIERLRHIKLFEEFAPGETVDEVVVPALDLYNAWFDTLVRSASFQLEHLALILPRTRFDMSTATTFYMPLP